MARVSRSRLCLSRVLEESSDQREDQGNCFVIIAQHVLLQAQVHSPLALTLRLKCSQFPSLEVIADNLVDPGVKCLLLLDCFVPDRPFELLGHFDHFLK